jgi:ribosomal protein L7Ae-like RNA K-turn-binding protein
MIKNDYSFLGLIQKSGNLVSGSDVVEMEIKKKKCKLLIISMDASDNTREKFEKLARLYNVNYVTFGNKEEIGISIGKSSRSILSIKDENFAKGFLNKIGKNNSGGEKDVENKDL